MTDGVDEIRQTLAFALEKYPHRVEITPVENLLLDSARQSGKRPAYLKIATLDETVKSLRGKRRASERLLIVRMPSDLTERAASPIILPNEIG